MTLPADNGRALHAGTTSAAGAGLYFEMIDESNRKLYLIFGTQHERGLEKMKDAMWKVDPSYGVRYRDPRDTQQQMLDFGFEPDTALLRRILREFISEAPDG